MARNPFSFLDTETQESVLLLILQAIIRRSEDQKIELSLEELTAVNDGDSLMRYPSDKGDRLVLRFARKGAAAYFRKGDEPSPSSTSRSAPLSTRRIPSEPDQPGPPRHAVHDDLDLALREEEMAQRAQRAARDKLQQARAEAGAMPWRTRPPQ